MKLAPREACTPAATLTGWLVIKPMLKKMLLDAPLAIVAKPISPSSLFQHSLPWALLILGVVVTVAWTALLGYGFVELVKMAL